MSVYISPHCLFHAICTDNADEVAYITRHNNFESNAYLVVAIEQGCIKSATQLLSQWDFCQQPMLNTLIEVVNDVDFAHAALARIQSDVEPAKDINSFIEMIKQAARLGHTSWVKELAHIVENELWYNSSLEIEFWKNAVHEGKDVLILLLNCVDANLKALEAALLEAHLNCTEVVKCLTPYVTRLQKINQAIEYWENDNTKDLKHLLSTMPERDIVKAYEWSDHKGLTSTWVTALPSLEIMRHTIPLLLQCALLEKDLPTVNTLLPHYTVISQDNREERKHEPNIVRYALKNPDALAQVLKIIPPDHPHIAEAINHAVSNKMISVVNQLLGHSPNMCAQALFSALGTSDNIDLTTVLLERVTNSELDLCVKMMNKEHIRLAGNVLQDLIEPRLQRWRLNNHTGKNHRMQIKRKI